MVAYRRSAVLVRGPPPRKRSIQGWDVVHAEPRTGPIALRGRPSVRSALSGGEPFFRACAALHEVCW
jgi:hypothetical protein